MTKNIFIMLVVLVLSSLIVSCDVGKNVSVTLDIKFFEFDETIPGNSSEKSFVLTNKTESVITIYKTEFKGSHVSQFNVLEGSSSVHLGKPEIKLLDKDKAIELEIEFENQKISPAFKLLSESQINSYGLAIFLSCIRHFNKEFKFTILFNYL